MTVAGRPVRLKDGEYKLLHTLSLDAGGATTYQSLRRRVWETRGGSNPRHILNERGLGYRTPGPEDALGRKRAGSPQNPRIGSAPRRRLTASGLRVPWSCHRAWCAHHSILIFGTLRLT